MIAFGLSLFLISIVGRVAFTSIMRRVEALEERARIHLESISVQQHHLVMLSIDAARERNRAAHALFGVDRDPPPRWRP